MIRQTGKRRMVHFLEFATGFCNAATVLPLLVVLPAMLIASMADRTYRSKTTHFYLLGLICGFPFAIGLFAYGITKRG